LNDFLILKIVYLKINYLFSDNCVFKIIAI